MNFNWTNKQDNVDFILAKDVNILAEGVVEGIERAEEAENNAKGYIDKKCATVLVDAKNYTDTQSGSIVKEGQGWAENVPGFAKIILQSGAYYHPNEPSANSFVIRDGEVSEGLYVETQSGVTLIFDVSNKESNTVISVDETTGEENTIEDVWGVLAIMEHCTHITSDLGCSFLYYNEIKRFIDTKIGNIDAALDAIITIQNGILGVSE
jgi:hypothetical protein